MRFLILIILLFSCLSCQDPNSEDYDSDADLILGDWRWIRTTGGIAGVDETEASTGRSAQLKFTENNEIQWVVSDQSNWSGDYSLGYDLTVFSVDSLPVILVDDVSLYWYEFSHDDTLHLAENYVDGFYFTLVRE